MRIGWHRRKAATINHNRLKSFDVVFDTCGKVTMNEAKETQCELEKKNIY